MSSILPTALDSYLHTLAGPEDPLLAEVAAYTEQHFAGGAHMLSGRYQGRLLAWFSRLVQPLTVLEIGTFTGYSALCLAEGMAPGGMFHTLDRDTRLEVPVRDFIARSRWPRQIQLHLGPAIETLQGMEEALDLVFIDADKRAYGDYLEAVLPRCRSGALILIDNVLWKGRLYDPDLELDQIGSYLQAFNQKLAADPRLDALMLPVRDGIWAVRVR